MLRNHSTPYDTPTGQASKDLIEKGQRYFIPNYKQRPMILDHGKGARVWDKDGNDYIDFGCGISVTSLGHQDEDLIQALTEQAGKLWHTSNIFYTEPPILLAEALVEAVPFAHKVYLCNSGAEANEAAIKLVRKYAAEQGRPAEKREIITFVGSFHGRTLATVTATAQPKYQQGFEPLPGGFVYVDGFNDLENVNAMVTENTCAILVEPIQGEGGVVPAMLEFLQGLRRLCDEQGLLLVLDEVQTGLGRTGALFAHMGYDVAPDIMTTAKALGGGIPIGALLANAKVMDIFQFGSHGSTFGGNPIMASVALAALKKINSPALLQNVSRQSGALFKGLNAINQDLNLFKEIRGRGLMIGMELLPEWAGKAGDFSETCRRFGVLVLVAGPNVLRLLPPLTLTDEEREVGLERMKEAFIFALKA